MKQKIPVLFVGHGSPMVAVEEDAYTASLENAAITLPNPEAIVVVSAHWEAAGPVRVMAGKNPPIIHDFYGFPHELYELNYPSPGHPALAKKVSGLFSKAGLSAQLDFERGLDHGAWIPLLRLYPKAAIPVIQVTLPVSRGPKDLVQMGKTLAPLREEGILLNGNISMRTFLLGR